MFDFLKRLRGVPEAAKENQRERFTRLIEELNEAIADLPEKPAVTVTPETGSLSFDLPEQFPDEALALPKPEEDPAPESPPADAAESEDSATEDRANQDEADEGEAKEDEVKAA